MLWSVFSKVMQMSIAASLVSLVIIPLKTLLQKISFPRKYLMLLWLIVGVRLICPFVPESNASVFNLFESIDTTGVTQAQINKDEIHITTEITTPPSKQIEQKSDIRTKAPLRDAVPLLWLIGIVIASGYSIAKSRHLKKKLICSIKLADNIYESDCIATSFVMGFFRPRIYIPQGISAKDKENMAIHEKTHIRYMHNRIKLIMWFIASVHWFNPIVWVMFSMVSADMEYICDEISIENVHRKSYMETLLNASCALSQRSLPPGTCSFSPLPQKRIISLAKYKRQSRMYLVPVMAICVVSSFVLCTNAAKKPDILISHFDVPYASQTKNYLNREFTTSSPTDTIEIHGESEVETPSADSDVVLTTDIPSVNAYPDLGKYKSTEKSDMPYEGFYNLEPQGINADILSEELEKGNIFQIAEKADLSKNYIKGKYTSTPDGVTFESITCDENGNISLYISLNTDSTFEVNICDSITGDNVYSCMVLATGKNAISFMGFEQNKKYDINLKEMTNGQWKTEGTYIIY